MNDLRRKGDKQKIKRIACPLCGQGEIEAPFNFKEQNIHIQHRSRVAIFLKKEGFSIRQIMRLFGYKSTASVTYLINYKKELNNE